MKIIIQDEGKEAGVTEDKYENKHVVSEVSLSDDAFDVPGWISLEIGGVPQVEVHISDLYPAVLAFYERWQESKED